MADISSLAPLYSKLKWDEKFHRTYTSVYQVIARYDLSPAVVASAVGLPKYGTSYTWGGSVDLWAFCKSVDVDRKERIKDPVGGDNNMAKWICTFVHSSIPSDNSNNNQTPRDNPLDEPAVISGSFSPYNKQVYRDKDGAQIQNSAKQPYNPPVETGDAYDTLKISFNTQNINLRQRAEFRGCVNSLAMWGLQPRQIKLTRWDWRVLYVGTSMRYVKHDFEFLISYQEHPTDNVCIGEANKVGWYTTLPNSGELYYADGVFDSAHEKNFEDSEDHQATGPRKLTCDGDKAEADSEQLWNVFEVEKEKNFLLIPGVTNYLPGPFV